MPAPVFTELLFICSNVKACGRLRQFNPSPTTGCTLGLNPGVEFLQFRGSFKGPVVAIFQWSLVSTNSHELRRHLMRSNARGFRVAERWQCSLHVFSHKSSRHRDFLQPSPHWFTSYVACRRHKGRLYYYWLGTPISYPCREFFFTVISTWTHTVWIKSAPSQPVYCLFSPVCRHPHPNPDWSYHITQLCTRAPVSECSPQVMDSVSGMWDPLRWLFSAHALWRVIPFPLQFNLGTEARGALGQRLYRQRLGVAALSELRTEERPVWFLRVFHIFVS